ncbi:helix-turn-helix domain-containing protein [Actinomycetospora sp. CA-084318]|uniref:helix-turn-helix domain-containing protein n=1 Tax=Actinomycetospora sp. CA-084318 TaxID=3239892 RepID=UPI003D966388
MYDRSTVDAVLALHADGVSTAEIARRLGIGHATAWRWCRGGQAEPVPGRSRRDRCPLCHGVGLDQAQYAYLLGQYLGDGHIVEGRRGVASLSVACADDWPGIRAEVERAMRAVMPTSSVSSVRRVGCREVKSYSTHWTCLFPQHGPGRKHDRPIVLAPWQDRVAREHAGRLLRGLIHSDGCRITNWARPRPDGKRYDYPRYWFSNHSTDILDICSRALDEIGVEHRRPRWNAISVARKASVARLDEFVGPKY